MTFEDTGWSGSRKRCRSAMITVLRLGHRPSRDKRVTTHVGLVARTFGASGMVITTRDDELAARIAGVNGRFGGSFTVKYERNWKKFISSFEGIVVHLTMYGERLPDVAGRIDRDRDMLIVVGAEKVPKEVYSMAHYNVSVGNQPHSEIAALAIFLDRITGAAWERAEGGGRMKIIPSARGKRVEDSG